MNVLEIQADFKVIQLKGRFTLAFYFICEHFLFVKQYIENKTKNSQI